MPPPQARPEPLALGPGDAPGLDAVAEHLALAGYERVDRVQERGHFAVRGGLVDVFPTTGRDPIRIEFFGDEIEAIRAFSPFTQRALHDVEGAVVYPAAERRLDLQEPRLTEEGDTAIPRDLVPPLDRAPDLVWEPEQVREVWAEEFEREALAEGRRRARPVPARAAVRLRGATARRSRRAVSRRPRPSWPAFVSAGNRVVVAFPHRGEALRTANLLRRVEPRLLEPGEPLPDEPELLFAVSPARRGFVWRDLGLVLLPDTQVFRKRPPRDRPRGWAARSSRSPTCARATSSSTRTTAIGKLLGFETKTVAEVTRDYLFLGFRGDDRLYVPHEQIGKVSKLHRRRRDGARALQARRQGVAEPQEPRARPLCASSPATCSPSTRAASRRPGMAYDLSTDWFERLEAEFPYRETEDQRTAIEAVKEDLEAPRPMDRLVCGDVGFGKTEVAVRAAFAAAVNGKQTLMLVPTTVLAEQHWNTFRERYRDFPVSVEMISRFRRPAEQKRVLADFAAGKVDVLIGTHRVLSRDVIPKDLGLVVVDEEQRFGVAQKELLRALRLEVDVLALTRDADPAHAAHVALRACATSR